MDKQQFFDRAEKVTTYEVVKPLEGWFARYKNKGLGHRFNSETLFKRGYNINELIVGGYITPVPKVFPFEEKITGKNQHSVWTKCKECMTWRINMPLDTNCSECGYSETITYYDAETIQKYIDSLIP